MGAASPPIDHQWPLGRLRGDCHRRAVRVPGSTTLFQGSYLSAGGPPTQSALPHAAVAFPPGNTIPTLSAPQPVGTGPAATLVQTGRFFFGTRSGGFFGFRAHLEPLDGPGGIGHLRVERLSNRDLRWVR